LCREVAEESETPKSKPVTARVRGVLRYSDVLSRQNYYASFKAALAAVTAKVKLTAPQKAALADSVADASVHFLERHTNQGNCAVAAATSDDARNALTRALNTNGPWGDAYFAALQTTAGGDYKSPEAPVANAAEIADHAVLVAGQLDEDLWSAFMKCRR
jgi:hypothetical protein